MKSKHLLLMLLLALMAPWAANAQSTLNVYQTESGTNSYVPIFGNWADSDQHNQMIYPADVLATMGDGATISQMVFYTNAWSSYKDIEDLGTWTVKLGETTATTLSALDGTTTLTEVFSDVLVCNSDHTTITIAFTSNYTYNGGNLLVDITHDGADYIDITFKGKNNATSASIYQYDYYGSWDGDVQDFLPRVTITHAGGTVNPCQKPTLAEATLTQGDGSVATLTWTENGEADGWTLQYGTDNTFATCTEVSTGFTISGSTITANLTSLTAEQKYYARVKPNCDTDGSKLSNVIDFTPTNAITYSVYDDPTKLTNNDYVPIYSNWQDEKLQSEYIIPATELADITDGTIKAIKLYPNYNFTSTQTSWKVYVREVDETTFPSTSPQYYGLEGSTEVYSGGMSYTSADGLTINFNGTGYVYNGGNLLIGFYQGTGGNHLSGTFKGQNVDGASISAYGTNSPAQRNFIPKTTFSYLPCNTPKPKNLSIVENSLSSSGVTLQWQAPTTATPTGYEYQYKVSTGEWPTTWTTATGLTAPLSALTATTDYTFRVRAKYAEGNSDPAEIEFTTLDNCAIPTGFAATTIPGQGTKATFSWTKGFVDDDDWVLQYGTDNTFTTCTEITDGFTVEGNTVSYTATSGITAEQLHYARVRTDCGGTYSTWSNVAEFTPTNYVDYTYNNTASSTSSYVPFYYYTTYSTNQSQFIIPAASLADVAGGQIRSITYYTSSTATLDFGGAEFDVYMAEVEQASFSSATFVDWTTLGTPVYSGTVSLANSKMTITFGDDFSYNGGNLLIGFKVKTTGSNSTSFSWTVVYNSSSYTQMYQYGSNSAQRTYYQPKVTLNYRPTVTPRPIITEPVPTTDVTATVAWTKPSDNVTGYKYQYKLTSATEWPTAWTEINDANAVSVTVPNLTPNSNYDFRMKAVYAAGESTVSSTSFATTCPAATAVPYTYDFETAPKFNCWTVATGSSVTRKNGSSTAHGGSYYMCFNGSQVNEIAMPSFNEPTNTLRLEFWVRPESYTNSDCGSLAIGYYNASNEFVALKTYEYNTSTGKYDGWEGNTYKKDKIDFDVAGVPADANIIFRQFNTSQNYWWYVDDVKVKLIPTCEDVDNVHYVSYTNHSATIAWTADAGQSAWQIAYKAGANFNPNDATELASATIVDATANPYLFDMTLEADATYYMYVRANCTASSDGYGDWSDSYATFTTFEATPAPSSFTASNLASQQVDLKWVEGGGDGEISWDLYYVKSTTAPTPPTASTPATETVTTMPTPADPYVLKNLDPESTYYIWVRSNYVWNSTTSHSDWVALTGDSFTTLNNCPTPNNVEIDANSITAVEAIVTWVGSMDVSSYTVEYGEEGTYSLNETVDFSGLTTAGYSSEGVLPEGWKRYNSNAGYMPHVSNKASCGDIDEFGTGNNYLLMTQNKSSNQYLYAIMPQISNLASLEFKYVYESTGTGVLSVGYVTDNTGYSTYQVLQTPTKSGTVQTFKLNATDIATINANNGYVTFRYEGTSTTYYSVGIDDIVYKGGTYTPGPTETKPATEQQITLTGLTPNKTYNVRVKSDCTGAEWSTYASFTTLPDGTKVFKTTGEWGTAANWSPSGAPALTDDVILRADATIENGCVATANSIAPSGNTLAIADGGQLQTNTAVTATVKKNITGYGAGNENNRADYYLIGNPLSSTINSSSISATGMLTGDYDLYQFLYTYDLEWRNYETSTFSLNNGTGYLYANENDVELTFTGTVKANNVAEEKTPSYYSTNPDEYEFNGWNLFANPFVCDAYLVDAATNGTALPYYKMNDEGTNITAQITTGAAIAPMEGIFYEASSTTKVFFTRTNPAVTSTGPKGNLNILVSNSNTRGSSVIDNAIISFGNPNTLGKLNLFASDARVFIPQDGKDYAVAYAESNVGEMPLNFKAEKNGAYTLSFTAEEVGFSYLHLIDNMTGADIDLLAGASTGSATYTFNAKTTDYASRFRLVFATGSSVEDDNFGFINGSGNLCIFGIEGTATLQVIDVTGRILSSETFSGSYEKGLNAAPGVYVMRLINGNEVKTQKIVVR